MKKYFESRSLFVMFLIMLIILLFLDFTGWVNNIVNVIRFITAAYSILFVVFNISFDSFQTVEMLQKLCMSEGKSFETICKDHNIDGWDRLKFSLSPFNRYTNTILTELNVNFDYLIDNTKPKYMGSYKIDYSCSNCKVTFSKYVKKGEEAPQDLTCDNCGMKNIVRI